MKNPIIWTGCLIASAVVWALPLAPGILLAVHLNGSPECLPERSMSFAMHLMCGNIAMPAYVWVMEPGFVLGSAIAIYKLAEWIYSKISPSNAFKDTEFQFPETTKRDRSLPIKVVDSAGRELFTFRPSK